MRHGEPEGQAGRHRTRAAHRGALATVAVYVAAIVLLVGSPPVVSAQGRAPTGSLVDSLRAARTADPTSVETALALSSALAGVGRLEEATALHDTLLAAPQPPAAVYRQVGRFWAVTGRTDTAVAVLAAGTASHPGDMGLRALRGWALEQAGDPEGSRAAYREAAARTDEPAWLDLRRAAVARSAADDPGALRVLEELVRPDVPLVAALVGAEMALELDAPATAEAILDAVAAGGIDVTDGPRNATAPATGSPGSSRWIAELRVRTADAAGRYSAAGSLRRALASDGSPTASVALLDGGALVGAEERDVLERGIRGGLQRVGQGERALLSLPAPPGAPTAEMLAGGSAIIDRWTRDRLAADRAALGRLMDVAILERSWGAELLDRLRRGYDGSPILDRYVARLALVDGDHGRALDAVDGLLDRIPRDPALHMLRARALEGLGRSEAALWSYGVALELDAGRSDAFRALLRLHSVDGSLDALLDRVQRLRSLSPEDTLRIDHELELLHRLGRLQAARNLAEQRAEIVKGGGA